MKAIIKFVQFSQVKHSIKFEEYPFLDDIQEQLEEIADKHPSITNGYYDIEVWSLKTGKMLDSVIVIK